VRRAMRSGMLGLGADWLRQAVRDTATTDAFIATLTDVLKENL